MHPSTLLQLLWLVGSPPGSCTEPPRVASRVLAYHESVEERTDYNLAQIRELAQRNGKPSPHAPLGFYLGGLGEAIALETERQASPDGSRCDYLTTVTVQLSLVDRIVQVAADLDSTGCDRTAVHDHYLKHAAADDRALSQYVQTVSKALRDAWPLITAKLSLSGHPDEVGLRQVVRNVLDRTSEDFRPVRQEAIAAVDDPYEIQTLACASKT